MSVRWRLLVIAFLFLLAGGAGAPVPDLGSDSPPADLDSPPEHPDGVDPTDP
ncbi:nuclease, partial [Halorubrum distributum]